MGEALFDLEQILRSKQVTPQETSVLLTCKSEAIKDFVIGGSVGAGLTWLATGRVKTFLRINLLAGGAFIAGMWKFTSSLDSCVDHILSMDGSRMQSELANIIVNKHKDNPRVMQRIFKHFYVEEVYDDSRPDQPKLRWRPRNAFSEKVDGTDKMSGSHRNGSHNNSDHKQTDLDTLSRRVPDMKDTKQMDLLRDPKKVSGPKSQADPGLKTIADPLDYIFGYLGEAEQPSENPSSRPATNSRRHRRAHRRRRLRQQHEASSPNTVMA